MRVPMPSPAGTNRAGLFVNRPLAGAAYDEKLPDDAAAALHEFLKDKLTLEDIARFCELAGIDAGQAMDDEGGMPKNGVEKFGQDSARCRVARVRTLAARIRVNA